MTARRLVAALIVAIAAAGAGWAEDGGAGVEVVRGPEDAPAPYTVVLADGAELASRTLPASGFGKVRFLDADGRAQVLPAARVDLEATRAANSDVATAEPGGTFSVAGSAVELGGGLADAAPTPVRAPRPAVRVYSATWCGPCRMLKRFLAEQGIAAAVTDVDLLPPDQQARAHDEMRRLTGRVAYPTIVIGGDARTGFSPKWILDAVGGR